MQQINYKTKLNFILSSNITKIPYFINFKTKTILQNSKYLSIILTVLVFNYTSYFNYNLDFINLNHYFYVFKLFF